MEVLAGSSLMICFYRKGYEMSRYYNDTFVEDVEENELAHFGVLGMKWGVRRYQNKDGSLTAAGKRKYKISSEGKLEKRSKAEIKSYDKKVSALKNAQAAKKRKEKIRKAVIDDNDLDTLYEHANMFTTQEINDAVNRSRAIGSLNDQRRVTASEAKKWIDTAVGYGTTISNVYKLLSSNEMQGAISYINDQTGSNLKLLPNSYQNYNQIYHPDNASKNEDKKK